MSSTLIIVFALLAAWLAVTAIVVAACRMARQSDDEIEMAVPTERPVVAPLPLRARDVQPRGARFAARS
jgi:hypothetical protein